MFLELIAECRRHSFDRVGIVAERAEIQATLFVVPRTYLLVLRKLFAARYPGDEWQEALEVQQPYRIRIENLVYRRVLLRRDGR
ncbi:hypothetical protein CH294_00750 [Rhodococcus sp. 14-2483-1-1]|nr:hypothetical protein CH294_00750 [Rhodococcus sp. 14-2483-1-1]